MKNSIEELFIVLVEPSGAQSKIIIKQFEELGIKNHEVIKAGGEALAYIDSARPDLVISAMYLPDMTGAELVRALRKNDEHQDLVFMLISTQTSFAELDPVRQAGAAAILPKPFNASQLKRALLTSMDYLEIGQLQFENFDPESLNVLIVDDSNFARKQIMRTLGKMGIEKFSEAKNGKQAILAVDREFFDLVVTDFNMPEMDGQALIEYIRIQSNQPGVPILMVTSEGNMSKLAAVEQSGVSAICDKPFEPGTVKGMIEAIMADTTS